MRKPSIPTHHNMSLAEIQPSVKYTIPHETNGVMQKMAKPRRPVRHTCHYCGGGVDPKRTAKVGRWYVCKKCIIKARKGLPEHIAIGR